MIERNDLETLYNSELKDKLQGLEGIRKKVKRGQVFGILLLVLTFLLFVPAAALLEGYNEALPFISIAPLAIIGIVILVRTFKNKKIYRNRFKDEVVREIVKAIDPTWEYNHDQCITSSEYRSSDLFRQSVDRYRGDDLISGKIDKTDFRCSELHTEYKTVTTDKDGKRKETWHTIFKGLFFHADFNKEIKGKTYIEPDTAERLFGKFGQSLQMSSKGKLVKLENLEFEKIFAVFGTDQTEARYILTPTIMEALVNIYKKYKRKMHLSFIGSRVYVAISFNKNLFEPKVFSSGVKFKDIEFMYNLFEINQIIIQELNLNTRIWTKE
ncbi:MAG: DUF3137 domain-containing protein [Tenuifilaceae bacterium]|jgi:hypothetical protein|uniref:DUF3137 domain-containing protein n=1 Tax=Perlabentimonas gracilis TaxID=2715279 RepID=UPI00140848F9|nr:DUF3137 domain-containing protein [Perlabentimonas gracilis]MDX9768947.1 DUF3137 domain-containing protein [Tenuifilaceae bacterium]NHB68793.1 DUF3137 domain-containing protein [Perlabentimonas gracilis]